LQPEFFRPRAFFSFAQTRIVGWMEKNVRHAKEKRKNDALQRHVENLPAHKRISIRFDKKRRVEAVRGSGVVSVVRSDRSFL